MDLAWFGTLVAFALLVYVLFKRHAGSIAAAEEGVRVGGGSKPKRKKKGGNASGGEGATASGVKDDEWDDEGAGEGKKKKKKVVEVADPKRGLKAAAERGEVVDEEGFKTVVPAKSKDNKRRISEMSPEQRAAYLKRKEAHEDAKWNAVGASSNHGSNAYNTLNASHRPKTTGKALPAKKAERVVNASGSVPLQPTKEMLEKMAAIQAREEEIPETELDFRINAQGKWYPIPELLSTNDFDHAPQLVKVYINNPDSCIGGVFCKISGKLWAGEHTADEPWMVAGLVTPLQKLISEEATEVEATIAWQDGAAIKLSLPSGSGLLTLEHVRAPPKHPKGVFKVGFKDFVAQFHSALKGYLTFAEKMESGCEIQEAKIASLEESNPTKAAKLTEGLEKVRNKLPNSAKIQKHFAILEEAISNRWPEGL